MLQLVPAHDRVLLPAGIDPAKATVFVQSHVPAHSELQWLLNCVAPIGWLNRMIQFKEKARKQVGYTFCPYAHLCDGGQRGWGKVRGGGGGWSSSRRASR